VAGLRYSPCSAEETATLRDASPQRTSGTAHVPLSPFTLLPQSNGGIRPRQIQALRLLHQPLRIQPLFSLLNHQARLRLTYLQHRHPVPVRTRQVILPLAPRLALAPLLATIPPQAFRRVQAALLSLWQAQGSTLQVVEPLQSTTHQKLSLPAMPHRSRLHVPRRT